MPFYQKILTMALLGLKEYALIIAWIEDRQLLELSLVYLKPEREAFKKQPG